MAMMCAVSKSNLTFLVIVAMLLAACGPDEKARAASDAVVAGVADKGAAWPLLLQHCLSSAHCDPMSDFGDGSGEASGVAGSTVWFFQTRERAGEGAEDYGPKAEINLFGMRANGGPAGRPLTIDELPDNLGGAKAKRTTLSLEYRAPSGVLEPYFLQIVSPHITKVAEGVQDARLEIRGAAGVLFAADAAGMEALKTPVNGGYDPPESMIFHVSRNLRDEPLPDFTAALETGDTLSVKLLAADGRSLLQDVLYTDGFASALALAGEAETDAEIARPIAERCARFADKDDAFWKIADVTAALVVCDPRRPERRR
jgi:hypothetical protein